MQNTNTAAKKTNALFTATHSKLEPVIQASRDKMQGSSSTIQYIMPYGPSKPQKQGVIIALKTNDQDRALKTYVKSTSDGAVTYSIEKNSDPEAQQIGIQITEMCRIAVAAAKDNQEQTVFTIADGLDTTMRDLLEKGFTTAIKEAMQKHEFPQDKEPRVEGAPNARRRKTLS